MRGILDLTVGDLMTTPPMTVIPEAGVDDLLQAFIEHDVNAFPVVTHSGVLVGLVSRSDLFRLYLLPYAPFTSVVDTMPLCVVGSIMTRRVVTLTPGEPALRALALMVDHGVRMIPVVHDGPLGRHVVGVITRRNLLPALLDEKMCRMASMDSATSLVHVFELCAGQPVGAAADRPGGHEA